MAPPSASSAPTGATPAAPAPAAGLRLGVTCAGDPADLHAYSGSPRALLTALEALGAEVTAVRGELGPSGQAWLYRALVASRLRPRHLPALADARRRLHDEASMSPLMPRTRALAARRAVHAAGGLDGVVQYGTEFDLPAGLPFVTIEDSTFLQALRAHDYRWLAGATPERTAAFAEESARRYRAARACTFMSHWAARACVADHAIPAAKVHVVGVGRHHEPPCPPRDWSVPRLLFVGRDWERKNGPAVIRAFARLREERPDARLDLVGAHPRVDVPGVTGHGVLSLADHADRARAEALFGTATAFVMPSLHEPAGIVYAEAQAAGLASIGTTSGGAATVIGDAGILVDPRDDAALLDAMRHLAEPARAAELGARALERAPLFTWRAVAERLLRALAPTGRAPDGLAGFL